MMKWLRKTLNILWGWITIFVVGFWLLLLVIHLIYPKNYPNDESLVIFLSGTFVIAVIVGMAWFLEWLEGSDEKLSEASRRTSDGDTKYKFV